MIDGAKISKSNRFPWPFICIPRNHHFRPNSWHNIANNRWICLPGRCQLVSAQSGPILFAPSPSLTEFPEDIIEVVDKEAVRKDITPYSSISSYIKRLGEGRAEYKKSLADLNQVNDVEEVTIGNAIHTEGSHIAPSNASICV